MGWLILAILACGGDDPTTVEARTGVGAPPPVQIHAPHPARTRLEGARDRYRRIVEAGGWPLVGRGERLVEGDAGSEITRLRERLRISGDLPYSDGRERLDRELAEALKRFQRRHGLEPTGELDPVTRAALDVPASERLAQIEANLAAWEALDVDFGEQHVVVNIPEFVLRAFDGGVEVLQMKVVVGDEYDAHRTPRLSDEIDHVVFRPHWYVPVDIARDEIVPRAQAEPGWFEAQAFQIVEDVGPDATPLDPTPENLRAAAEGRLRVRQVGGELNALGLVKFMFPNEHSVYLHDTPAEELFDKAQRVASHGCVRVEDPVALADFVLDRAAEPWPPERISAAMHDGPVHQVVPLREPMPIHLGYWTVWADDTEGLQFRPDVYGHFDEAPDGADPSPEGPADASPTGPTRPASDAGPTGRDRR